MSEHPQQRDQWGRFTSKPTPNKHMRVDRSIESQEIVLDLSQLPADSEPTKLDDIIKSMGLDCREWEVTKLWGRPDAPQVSIEPRAAGVGRELTQAEIDLITTGHRNEARVATNEPHVAVIGIGDMQFGKENSEEILERTLSTIDKARQALQWYGTRYDITDVIVAFLGDHIEGFMSQGGNNVWRTPVPLTEQIRVTRRVMLYAACKFAEVGMQVHMLAVPGNHGEAVRINGRGITRYDDSHDTECLISVADAVSMAPERFEHVRFYVPESDELSVGISLADTNMVFTHGHMMKPNRYHDWVKGQAYNRSSIYRDADLVFMGHYHHEFVEASSDRMIIQVPTLESESQWWKHATGEESKQGIVLAVVGQGTVQSVEWVR